MILSEEIKQAIFTISGENDFENIALKIFRYQVTANRIYDDFCRALGILPEKVMHLQEIPFMPVGFFRDHRVISGNRDDFEKIFRSSGTTASVSSQHFVKDLQLYRESFTRSFSLYYGDPGHFRFLALLPGYLERQDSSLVYMMDSFIRLTAGNGSGFFLHDLDALQKRLLETNDGATRTILFGASYALLDFAELYPSDLSGITVMETGGMKGRKREMIREELHEILCHRFNIGGIHSEYGMTELLSQAYSQGDGLFRTPPWMKVMIRDTNDPMHFLPPGKTGGINIIDLANLHSCAFIATQDLGKLQPDGSFEVLGRFDDSDIRGCNLLVV